MKQEHERFSSNVTTCPLRLRGPPPAVAEVYPTSEVGTPSRRGYVVTMKMMMK